MTQEDVGRVIGGVRSFFGLQADATDVDEDVEALG
jgi:hypothetical protein